MLRIPAVAHRGWSAYERARLFLVLTLDLYPSNVGKSVSQSVCLNCMSRYLVNAIQFKVLLAAMCYFVT